MAEADDIDRPLVTPAAIALAGSCAKELADPRATVLVGAGACVEAGIPAWDDLLEAIAAGLDPAFGPAVEAARKAGRYTDAAEIARRAYADESRWQTQLSGFAKSGRVSSLWRLVSSLGLTKMVTTNWDNVGEDSFADVWQRSAPAYVGVDELLVPLDDSYPHIVHPHGKAPRWQTIVFTASEYERMEAEPRYREFWIDVLVHRPLLVVGFSGNDPAFRRLLRFVREDLKIIHKVNPFVVWPVDEVAAAEPFGPHARLLLYENSAGNHRGAAAVLRMLRKELATERVRTRIEGDPFKRAGVPEPLRASRDELIYSLMGVDLRSHCGAVAFVAVSVLLQRLATVSPVSEERLADLLVDRLRVGALEASDAARAAAQIARSQGWISDATGGMVGTVSTPRPDAARWRALIEAIASKAQTPVNWSRSMRFDDYIKVTILEFLGNEGRRAANSLLGLELGGETEPSRLQYSLERAGHGVGEPAVERQICRATMQILSSPPALLEETCGRLSNFALVHELVSLSEGRAIVQGIDPIEAVYADTNIVLPAIAPGHPWHAACSTLLLRCRRHVGRLLVTEGFLEELEFQLKDAEALAGAATSASDLEKAVLTVGRPNGFLQAFEVWTRTNKGNFYDYLSSVGLGSLRDRLNGLGFEVVRVPREWGTLAGLHAEVTIDLRGAWRPEKLVRHEADQIALLAQENNRRPGWPTRFVTAHGWLRQTLVRNHRRVAGAVCAPVALGHLLAATSRDEIPPASLRELTFDGPGVEVAEVLFGVLIARWKTDRAKLTRLAAEDVLARIREEVQHLKDRFHEVRSVDSRRELLRVVEEDVVPSIETVVAAAPKSATPTIVQPPTGAHVVDEARRLAAALSPGDPDGARR